MTPSNLNPSVYFARVVNAHSAVNLEGGHGIDLQGTAEFGRFMIPYAKHRGKGYGKKAIDLVLEYGFEHLNLHRIYLDTLESNTSAIGLYKKVGFKEEGRKKQHIYKNGKYFDLICMCILKGGEK